MLILDSGLWSGFQRQMELAESFGQPMITVSNGPFEPALQDLFSAVASSHAPILPNLIR